MPLAKMRGFECIFRKKSVVSLQLNARCHSFRPEFVTFLCRWSIILGSTEGLRPPCAPSGRCQGLARCFLRRSMCISPFAVYDRKGLLRWRMFECFWLLAGVQIPFMRDTLPSGKAEYLSGYDWSWGLSLVLQFMQFLSRVSICMNWLPTSLLGRTTGNG